MEEQDEFNPYTGGYMRTSSASKVRQEIIDRTTNTLRDAKSTDPELVINVVLIFALQFFLFRFLVS